MQAPSCPIGSSSQIGKRKIDKSKKIENKNQRSVAFCKRRRGFLKKAIEMSRLCDQQIFLIIYDTEKDKAIQYSSAADFQFSGAYKVIKRLRSQKNQNNLEIYTNDDYEKFELCDFRSLRYQKREIESTNEQQFLSEYEYLENEIEKDKEYKYKDSKSYSNLSKRQKTYHNDNFISPLDEKSHAEKKIVEKFKKLASTKLKETGQKAFDDQSDDIDEPEFSDTTLRTQTMKKQVAFLQEELQLNGTNINNEIFLQNQYNKVYQFQDKNIQEQMETSMALKQDNMNLNIQNNFGEQKTHETPFNDIAQLKEKINKEIALANRQINGFRRAVSMENFNDFNKLNLLTGLGQITKGNTRDENEKDGDETKYSTLEQNLEKKIDKNNFLQNKNKNDLNISSDDQQTLNELIQLSKMLQQKQQEESQQQIGPPGSTAHNIQQILYLLSLCSSSQSQSVQQPQLNSGILQTSKQNQSQNQQENIPTLFQANHQNINFNINMSLTAPSYEVDNNPIWFNGFNNFQQTNDNIGNDKFQFQRKGQDITESINEKFTEDYKASGDKSIFDLSVALSHTHKPELKELPKRTRQEELMSPMASTCRSKVNYFDD